MEPFVQGIVEAAEGAWPREEKMRGGHEHCAFWHRERFLSISWCARTAVLVILSCGLRRDPAPRGGIVIVLILQLVKPRLRESLGLAPNSLE